MSFSFKFGGMLIVRENCIEGLFPIKRDFVDIMQ